MRLRLPIPRRSPLTSLVGLAALALLTACPPSVSTPSLATTPSADAGAPDAASPSGAELDAGDGGSDASIATPPPPLLPPHVELVVITEDAGRSAPAVTDAGVLEVPPGRVLELTIAPRLKDARVRLIDWNDQVVESDDHVVEGEADLDGGTVHDGGPVPHQGAYQYVLQLREPLQAGRSYTLGLDSDLGDQLLTTAGAPLGDFRMTFKVEGAVSKSEPGSRPGGKRRRPR